jgi:phosphoadenosine phosphosulfate reductase
MKVTMVKKRLAGGNFCRKCVQVEELLKSRSYWERINEVILAEENNPDSPGMKLAAAYKVEEAPFFIVKGDNGNERVYTSALRLMREVPAESGLTESLQIDDAPQTLTGLGPSERIKNILKTFGPDCALAFSGAEDVILIDMAVKTGLEFSLFSLDTGRLHPETYRFIEKVREHYGIDIRLISPDRAVLEPFVRKKGLYSFYRDGHRECCGIRKVDPLRRALSEYRAWMTGQRKDQNPSTRGDVPVIQKDPSFSGRKGEKLVKINPIADWSLEQVWSYIREQGVPYNELHDRGFVSIGCEPCTRAVRPGEHERAGRWWWEDETKRECGLHVAGGKSGTE